MGLVFTIIIIYICTSSTKIPFICSVQPLVLVVSLGCISVSKIRTRVLPVVCYGAVSLDHRSRLSSRMEWWASEIIFFFMVINSVISRLIEI